MASSAAADGSGRAERVNEFALTGIPQDASAVPVARHRFIAAVIAVLPRHAEKTAARHKGEPRKGNWHNVRVTKATRPVAPEVNSGRHERPAMETLARGTWRIVAEDLDGSPFAPAARM